MLEAIVFQGCFSSISVGPVPHSLCATVEMSTKGVETLGFSVQCPGTCRELGSAPPVGHPPVPPCLVQCQHLSVLSVAFDLKVLGTFSFVSCTYRTVCLSMSRAGFL